MLQKNFIFSMLILFSIYLVMCYQIFEENHYDSLNVSTIKNESKKNQSIDYFAQLQIPKINLTQPLFSKEDPKNEVNQNVTILEESTLPDQANSLLVLAAHSGNGPHAYFNELDQLQIDDIIFFFYQSYQYTYQIKEIYEEQKTGSINVKKYPSQSQIVLTTCSPKHSQKQLIISGVLLKKERET